MSLNNLFPTNCVLAHAARLLCIPADLSAHNTATRRFLLVLGLAPNVYEISQSNCFPVSTMKLVEPSDWLLTIAYVVVWSVWG